MFSATQCSQIKCFFVKVQSYSVLNHKVALGGQQALTNQQHKHNLTFTLSPFIHVPHKHNPRVPHRAAV